MPKAHFDIYRAQVFKFAKTIVIKSVATAFTINEELKRLGQPLNEADPTTWKYYMNLAGQYHTTDQVMEVVSLDTLQTISFTVENLQIHRATAAAYEYGSRYYEELLTRYPSQETVIQGILNPVPLDVAIAAKDGSILYYDASLVEDNEENLITKLQAWIDGVFARWHVSAYQMTDELYVPSFLAMLYAFIPSAVMNIRNGNCHTRYAHSFHVKEFLASHGKLDSFVDYLTKKQMLWLYRNIRYIHRNAGKQNTLDWLIENILTERNIPIAEWTMTHNLAEMPTELYPKVEFIRNALNFGRHFSGKDTKTVEEMLDDEQPVARGNARVQPVAEVDVRRQMETSIRNEYSTKVLESAMVDRKDAAPFKFADFLLNHWMYLANTNRYNSFITFDDPRSGESTTMSTKDAFVVFLYAYIKSIGTTLTNVPTMEADMVRKIPVPTREQIRETTVKKHLPDAILDAYYSVLKPIPTFISIAGFRDAMREAYDGLMKQWFVWTQQENFHIRGQAEIAGLFFYQDVGVNLGDEQPYEEWFDDRSLPYADYNAMECELLATAVLDKAVGNDLYREISLAELQGALVRLTSRLSSYTIQFLTKINTAPMKVVDWNATRIGDQFGEREAHDFINVCTLNALSLVREITSLQKLSFQDLGVTEKMYGEKHHRMRIEVDPVLSPASTLEKHLRFMLPRIYIHTAGFVRDDFEADTPVRDTPQYVPSEFVELDEAFLNFSSQHYYLTPQDRTNIQLRWDAYITDPTIADPLAIPVVQLDGVTMTALSALQVTSLDHLFP